MRYLKSAFIILFGFFSVSALADTLVNETSGNKKAIEQVPAPSAPTNPLTGTFTLATNYMFRGISLTNNIPAVQGGYTYTFNSGIYLNAWASNSNFYDFHGKRATFELDTLIGITNSIWDQFSYNLSLVRYNYPRTDASYIEGILILIYHFITAQIGYSGNVYNTHSDGTYYNLGFKYDLPPSFVCQCTGITVSGGIGHYGLPKHEGLKSYNDYNIQISKNIDQYTLALLVTNTNHRSVDADELKDLHVVGLVTYNIA